MFFVRFISCPSERLWTDRVRKQKPVPEGTVLHTRDRLRVFDESFVQLSSECSNAEEMTVL